MNHFKTNHCIAINNFLSNPPKTIYLGSTYSYKVIKMAATIAINFGLCSSFPDPLKYASF